MSNSLQLSGLQHTRFPCLSPTPGACSKSCPLSRWCHPTIQPSNLCRPLLLPPSVFPSIRVFSSESLLHIRWPKYWSSASTSVLPMNTQDWSPLGWTGWISLQSQGLSRVFSNTTVQKHQFLGHSACFIYSPTLTSIHDYCIYSFDKVHIALTIWTSVGKVMCLLFNVLSRFVIAFLPRSKRLLISWLQSPSAVILEPPKIKSLTVSIVYPSIYHEMLVYLF